MSEQFDLYDEDDDVEYDDTPRQKTTPTEDDESDNPEHLKFRLDPKQPRCKFKHVLETEAENGSERHKSDTSKPYPQKKKDDVYNILVMQSVR